jgi:hypothetical protein
MRWAGYVALVVDIGKAYKVLVENSEGITPVGKSRRSEIDVTERGFCAWTGLIWLMIGTISGLL